MLVHDEPAKVLFGASWRPIVFAHLFRVLFAAVTAVIILFSVPAQEKYEASQRDSPMPFTISGALAQAFPVRHREQE